MPSEAQLKHQLRDLQDRLNKTCTDETLTAAEKKTALDAIDADSAEVVLQLSNTERGSEMNSKFAKLIGQGGELRDEDTKKSAPKWETYNPHTKAARYAMAKNFVQSVDAEKVFAVNPNNDGSRVKFDEVADVKAFDGAEFKDATEAHNLMGEGLYGATGPTAAGQQPFLPGAWGPGIQPDWRPGIVEQLFYPLTVGELFDSFATTSPNLSYLTESVVNLTANQVAEGATYPFASIEVARTYAQVGKIAQAMTVSDEAIADAPTLFNFVQGRLLMALQRQEEVQILAGGGYPGAEGLLGFASSFTASTSASLVGGATSGTGTNIAFPAAGTSGAGVVSQTISSLPYGRVITGQHLAYPLPLSVALNLKDAFVDIESVVFQSPTAVIMNPRDWQSMETAQDANGQFMNGSFFGYNYGIKTTPVKSIWGVPVCTSWLMPKGLMLAGWFSPQTVQVARREGVRMQMVNTNGTDFVEGLVTMRAEERFGFLCYRPTAFELISLVNG
jgi:HK97 family phage major capsid protein